MLSVVVFAAPTSAHAIVGDYGTLEDGTYTISAYLSPWMCWDMTDKSTSNNAKLQSYHHHGGANQVWKITTDSDGYSTIINVNSGKALDVEGGTVALHKKLQQYTPNGTKAQKWKIIERSTGYKIASALDESYVIDLTDYSTADGAAIQLWVDASTSATAQRWHIDKVADQTTTVLPDQTKLFDTSVYITDAQAGTYTWEKVPDGWEAVEKANVKENHESSSVSDIKVTALQYKEAFYSGGNAVAVLRVDDCGKVDGKSVSLRLTFSNIAGLNDSCDKTWIIVKDNNIWHGLSTQKIAQMDMKVELFESDSGEPISLKGAWFTGASLNYHALASEGLRYLAGEPFESYLIKGNGLEIKTDGTWQGKNGINEMDWEDWAGGNNFIISAVGLRIVDDLPTFRLYLGAKSYTWPNYTRFNLNFSPLTIATPEGPTKSATIME